MKKKVKTRKRGRVSKIIKSPYEPEKAEIAIEGADPLYQEIRIENVLEDEHGEKTKLEQGEKVEIIVEADPSSTSPTDS